MTNSRTLVRLAAGLLAAALLAVAQVPEVYRPALDAIQAQSMEGRLSFLASDLLEGRATPSRGLDLAAEYIASEFRAAGLEPAGTDGYFQTANWFQVKPKKDGLVVRLEAAGKSVTLDPAGVEARCAKPLRIEKAPVVYVDVTAADGLKALLAGALSGKVVVVSGGARLWRLPAAERTAAMDRNRILQETLRKTPPLAVLRLDGGGGPRGPEGFLVDPENPPTLGVTEAREFFTQPLTGVTATLEIPAPDARPVKLRNVAAVLRGSDPDLAKTYVLLSAHYDHVGMKADGEGDRIYNGADDDGSGVVSVLELAAALAGGRAKPKRSILFVTYFGEELGLLGSAYYARHPLVPLKATVANVNIEQVGRTDDRKSRMNQATFTGFDYSSMVAVFAEAGKRTGIAVLPYQETGVEDPYFSRSDNFSLARYGVVAHTVCVALEFPDYHGLGDEWQKIDYANMARTARMIALGTLQLADSALPPRWNAAQPAAKSYLP